MKNLRSMTVMALALTLTFSSSASALSLSAQNVNQVLTVLAQICKIAGKVTGNKIPYCDTLAEVSPAINDMAKAAEGISRGGDLLSLLDNGTKFTMGALKFDDIFSKDKSASDVNDSKNAADAIINTSFTTGIQSITGNPSGNPGTDTGQAIGLAINADAAKGLVNSAAGVNAASVLATSNGTQAVQSATDRAVTASEDGAKLLQESNLAVSTRATIGITNEILVKTLDHIMSNNLNLTSLIASSVQQQALTTQQISHLVSMKYQEMQQKGAGGQARLDEMQQFAKTVSGNVGTYFTATSASISAASNSTINLSTIP